VTDREAHDLVRAIEHLWHLDMGADGRTTWCNSLIQFDNVIASEAILKLSERQRERPTVADVRGMIAKIKRDRRDTTPAIEPPATNGLPDAVKQWATSHQIGTRR
jgi:hypothetical protein